MSEKEIVALDIDDVVVKHVEGFIAWSNSTFSTTLTIEDYTEEWHTLWGIHKDDVEERKKQFFVDDVVESFEIIEGASEGLLALSSMKKVVGVTSRRQSLQLVTEKVLESIAPGAVSDVAFATSFKDGVKTTRSKAVICQEIGAESLIDDQLKHCLAVAEVGIDAVLFGDYPWNRSVGEVNAGITRASDWEEVIDLYSAERSV